MAFRSNSSQQISLTDSTMNLTARERKALENSWAKVFAEEIFPAIDEERFSVLYSDKPSRYNSPINVTIGALIIKELFDYTDDELVENLMLDLHLQYALHTTSYEEQPLSDKTLSRFRKRCYEYETLYNQDLYHDCVTDLSEKTKKLMNITGRIRRMDSMMIESNIRKLSRVELIYTCVSRLATVIYKEDETILPQTLQHYADPNDFNRVMYHQRSSETDDRLVQILKDADELISICPVFFKDNLAYELLLRCLSEQTIVENGERRLRTKTDGGMNSKMMQNPSDPEATFRSKAGKEHRGYVANIEESVSQEGSVITDYQYDQNVRSDSDLLNEHLEKMDKAVETVCIVTDGAYYSDSNIQIAVEKNVDIVPTNLTGVPTPNIFADFEFSADGKRVLHCPAGHEPQSCCCRETNGKCVVSFPVRYCQDCPNRDKCNPKMHKHTASLNISQKGSNRAKTQRRMQEATYRQYYKFRNGVETIPSNLRRNYNIDKLPRGRQRGKFFFGCKVAALNFRKLFNYRKGLGHYAQNPIFG